MTLKQLHIHNIILVDNVVIDFTEGFNVLSGETGAGKSAIMGSLNLIVGDRADSSLIRRGEEKGYVEALFDIDHMHVLKALLADAGIDHEAGEYLLIRRELSTTGKARAFINHQPTQLALLKQVGEHLIDIVGQHANQRLFALDHHRDLVDMYGTIENEVTAFSTNWSEENRIRKELDLLIQSEAQRLRDIERGRAELDEIIEANVKDGEEEELFAEYTMLSNSDELTQKVGSICQGLSDERSGALAALSRHRSTFEQVVRLDASLGKSCEAYTAALIELQEVTYHLNNYLNKIDNNPQRLQQAEERLNTLHKLKRKYGPNISDILSYKEKLETQLKALENADETISDLQKSLERLVESNNKLASQLSNKRQEVSAKLSKEMVKHLRALNMPHVEFSVEITPQKRTKSGDDLVEFFLIPNVGEHKIAIRDCASGGELSRVMLALQALLADKENIPTVVFDEIDANIGGTTATVVGEKMRGISQSHQVICITHFPQVAKYADHHIQISKNERSGRTFTQAVVLDNESKELELARMSGGMSLKC